MKRHFELKEFLQSETAERYKINNFPTWEVVDHLNELVDGFLEPLRLYLDKPIIVNSGYRCSKLNKLVGGVATSAHLYGYAADIECPFLPFSKFTEITLDWIQDNNISFDQVIVEVVGGKRWLHVGYRNKDGLQRGQILNINK